VEHIVFVVHNVFCYCLFVCFLNKLMMLMLL